MKNFIIAILLLSALAGYSQPRTLIGIGPTGRPGYKYTDTLRSLNFTSPLFTLNDTTVSIDTSRIYAAIGSATLTAGANTQVIYNNGGTLTGNAALTFSGSELTVNGIVIGRGGGAAASNLRIGTNSMSATATGTNNIAVGGLALNGNTTGGNNIAIGQTALQANTTGLRNIAVGVSALPSSNGNDNVALGTSAMQNNVSGSLNTAVGNSALKVVTGSESTAMGYQSLQSNTSGAGNTALGTYSLATNVTGTRNVGIGRSALVVSTGSDNTSVGYASLSTATAGTNTAIGSSAGLNSTTGTGNIFLGYLSGKYATTQSNQIFINSIDRTTYAGDQTASPIYIAQNATVASQTIALNGVVSINGTLGLKGYTVSTLPTGTVGQMAYVTDATAPTYNGALTGGGAVTVPVFYNGSAWVSH